MTDKNEIDPALKEAEEIDYEPYEGDPDDVERHGEIQDDPADDFDFNPVTPTEGAPVGGQEMGPVAPAGSELEGED